MNKRVLAIAASAATLAAMPVVGVFAKDGDVQNVVDTINVTVEPSCTLGAEATKTASATVSNGTTKEDIAGSVFSITCNDGSGWHVTAQGTGEESHETQLWSSTASKGIATSSTISNATSGWAFKFVGTGVTEGYTDFKEIPSEATKIASGSSAVSGQSLSVTYGVGIDATQPSGTYSGKVTYVLATGAGA